MKMVGRHWGIQPDVVHKLIQGIIHPILFYEAVIWDHGLLLILLQKLDQILRATQLTITGCLRTTSYVSLYILSGNLSATVLMDLHVFKGLLHLKRNGIQTETIDKDTTTFERRIACKMHRLLRERGHELSIYQTQQRSIKPWKHSSPWAVAMAWETRNLSYSYCEPYLMIKFSKYGLTYSTT